MTSSETRKEKKIQMILEMEKSLQQSLKPINPDPTFVNRLENRLNNYPQISIERSRKPALYYLFWIGGFLMGISFIWAVWHTFLRNK